MSVGPAGRTPDFSTVEPAETESVAHAASVEHAHVVTGNDMLDHFAPFRSVMLRDGGTIKLDGPVGAELVAHIRYDGAHNSKTRGQFFLSYQVEQPVMGHVPPADPERPMTKAEERSLLGALDRYLSGNSTHTYADHAPVRAFVDHLKANLRA